MIYFEEFGVRTTQRTQWVDITSKVIEIIKHFGVEKGIVVVSVPHTTAGITINENADPDVHTDFFAKLDKLIPYGESFYRHMEGNSDSHLKASLVGFSVTLPINNKKLILGTWQSVYFCEFDGPRSRRVNVTINT